MSTPARPKQLLPLINQRSLLENTLERLAALADATHTLVLTNASLAEAIASMMPTLPAENIIAEPRPAGTAAALSWAAAEIARRDGADAIMISVHADWAIGNAEAFRAALRRAAEVARTHAALVTIGIVPHRPDTGFGYIRPGEVVAGDARRVKQFVEKPDRVRAEAMVREGCLWNSGIFVWRVGDFLDEVRRLTPEVAPALAAAGDNLQTFFAAVQNIAVDVGVLERSDRVIVLPGDFDWDDVGTWAALRRVRALDTQGNASLGRVHAIESSGNVAHAEAGDIVLFGVENLVVVQREGLTLVTTMDRAADLKRLVEALPASVRDRA